MLSNVLVIGNDKGGAGKSTLTANLAGQLAVAGWRTLVVDLDYQGDVSEHLGYADNPENDGGRNLMNAMVDGEPLRVLKDVGGHQGLDAIPAGRWTRLLTQHLASDSPEHDLETVLSAVASDYSAIICDTRPEVDNQLLLQALATARFVVIPFKKDKNDKASVRRYKAVVDRLKKNANPQLEILGSVLFLWRRGKPGLGAYLKERENESGVRPFRSVVCEASDACEDITDRGLLTYEYALEIEKILQDGGHAKTVSDRGYALSVAGTRVTKTQRLSGKVPKEAVVVSNVRLGGGLAADYHNLAQEVMEGIVERLAPQPAAASSAKDANGN